MTKPSRGRRALGWLANLLQQHGLLLIGAIGALTSALWIPPDQHYAQYFDWRSLGLLFCLFLLSEAGKEMGIFRSIGARLLRLTNTHLKLGFALVFLCFFAAMFITNDAALITFVPLSMLTLRQLRLEQSIPFIVVMQTIAANLGSMLTPLGSPQNLFLSNKAGFSFGDVFRLAAPYGILSAGLLAIALIVVLPRGQKIAVRALDEPVMHPIKVTIYTVLFVIGLLTVARALPLWLFAVLTVAVVAVDNWKLFTRVDYSLLATFVVLFIFVGNLGRVDAVHQAMVNFADQNLVLSAIVSSQVVSNVPATLLISSFTDNYAEVFIGVNVGGVGTLIASMASLISYRLIAAEKPYYLGRFLLHFGLWNTLFLVVLVPVALWLT